MLANIRQHIVIPTFWAGRIVGPRNAIGGASMEGDLAYFRRRANEERLAAMKAACPEARRSHLELAERYGDLADGIHSTDRLRTANLAG